MEQKYGRVYIVTPQDAANGTKTFQPELLESVLFSNINHKWYDPDGNLSPLSDNYKGRPISLQYKTSHTDKSGQQVKLEAKILLPLKLGELKPQDFESIPVESQKMIEHWESLGVLSGDPNTDDNYRIFRDVQSAAAVAAMSPGCKISDMKSLYASFDSYFLQDEYIDKDEPQRATTFKTSHPYFSASSDIVEGKITPEDFLKTHNKLPEKLTKFIKGLSLFRNELAKKEELAEHVYEAYRQYHEGLLLENCSEWKLKQEDPTSVMYNDLQAELRSWTIGGWTCVEMILFDQDIRVDKKIRESFLFKSLIRVYSQHCGLVNDLASYGKEMKNGETNNSVFLLTEKKGMALKDAYQKIVNQMNNMTQVVHEIGELLFNLFPEHPEVTKLVEVIKGIMYGNMQWSSFTKRYDQNIVCDCVVELG